MIKKLRFRHFEILRLVAMGWKNSDIAQAVGMTQSTISLIIKSPLAQMELEKLTHEANKSVTDVPLRVSMAKEIDEAAREAFKLRRAIIKNKDVDIKIRSRAAEHMMDRAIFNRTDDDGREDISFRTVLRELNEVARRMRELPAGTGVPTNGGAAEIVDAEDAEIVEKPSTEDIPEDAPEDGAEEQEEETEVVKMVKTA